MANGCSSNLMEATPPAFARLQPLAEQTLCLKRKHILLAFIRQSDVKTSQPSLPHKSSCFTHLDSGSPIGFQESSRLEELYANP